MMSATPELNRAAPAAQRLPEILRLLHVEHPDACCALDHRNALELLVATILSAQCTDAVSYTHLTLPTSDLV